jgi:hypothetical protein
MRRLNIATLAVSVLALGVSVYTWQQADARAEAALQRREKALVDKHRPGVVKFCQDFGIKEPPEDAQTIDELLAPLGGLFDGMSK